MFDHERLDVYRVSIEFVAWVHGRTEGLTGVLRHARDELIRASQGIPRNIAEGNGKRSRTDRGRFLEIARGSALECAAVLDGLRVMEAMTHDEVNEGKSLLVRIVAMLTKMSDQARTRVGEGDIEYDASSAGPASLDYDYEHEHEHGAADAGCIEGESKA